MAQQERRVAIFMNASIFSASNLLPRTSHSHSSKTDHPSDRSAFRTALSRFRFRLSFAVQYALFVFGRDASLHVCPCQKQPCTMMILLNRLKTISGRPGKSLACNRKRYPKRCRIDLTVFSGRVSLLLILDITTDRLRCEKTSIYDLPKLSRPSQNLKGEWAALSPMPLVPVLLPAFDFANFCDIRPVEPVRFVPFAILRLLPPSS
jgi:hypothetical protein